MKITNKTKWETKHIARFVREVIRRAPPTLRDKYKARGYPKTLTVEVVYNRAGKDGSYVTGCAPYFGKRITLKLGGHQINKYDLCSTIQHELAHNLGYTHADMGYRKVGLFWWGGAESYPWAADLPLEKKQPKAKPKGTELQEHRYKLVLAGEERWNAKLKRAQSALKKLRVKRRYYENKLAAKGAPKQ